ncbi:MAG: hypothetical protein ACE5HQ_02915 [Gemmatimonadota bacterium]
MTSDIGPDRKANPSASVGGIPAELLLDEEDVVEDVPEKLLLAFAPLHKRALGLAVGLVFGALVFALTLLHVFLIRDPSGIRLLGQYFYGYSVSVQGAFIGLFWGFVTGFTLGWFAAFCRNLAIATFMFLGRTRAELRATRDFLDHI